MKRITIQQFGLPSSLQFALALLLAAAFEARPQPVAIPDLELERAIRLALVKPSGDITAQDMESLTELDASLSARGATASSPPRPPIRDLKGLESAINLKVLNLTGNWFAPDIETSDLSVLARLPHLRDLILARNWLTSLSLPAGLTNLTHLNLGGNELINLSFLSGLPHLTTLDLSVNGLTFLALPPELAHLTTLDLSNNRLAILTLPADGLTSLTTLKLAGNFISEFSFIRALPNLATLDLTGNYITSLNLPSSLTSLRDLHLEYNQLTSLTLPPSLTNLTSLNVEGNPLKVLVLPESSAPIGLVPQMASLRNQGTSLYTYSLALRLVPANPTVPRAFGFMLAGPPGTYTVLSSVNLVDWDVVGTLRNQVGTVGFTDSAVDRGSARFYRARSPTVP